MVIADQARFIQCASTLIQNAFSNMINGPVNILLRYDAYKQQVYFEVEDFARGIRQKDFDYLQETLDALNFPNINDKVEDDF